MSRRKRKCIYNVEFKYRDEEDGTESWAISDTCEEVGDARAICNNNALSPSYRYTKLRVMGYVQMERPFLVREARTRARVPPRP